MSCLLLAASWRQAAIGAVAVSIGRMTKSKHTHTATGHTTHTQCGVYTYDNWDRLLTHTHQMDGASAITLASNTYDGIGRLITNSRNGTTNLSTSRSYNVRSWLKTLTNNKFSETLFYNTTRSGSSMPACWNGNISSMEWTLYSNEYSYDFRYDKLHRLTDAKYDDEFGDEEAFMTNYGYDKNGNIDGIMRQALNIDNEPTPLDEMWLYYTGNQLQSITNYADPDDFEDYTPYPVSESSNPYSYDQNGNTTKDLDRNISSIQYNLLNLPRSITYTDGSMATYTYNSLGEKLQVTYSTSRLTASLPATNVAEKVLSDGSESSGLRSGMTNMTMDYFGNLVYNGNNLSRVVLGNDGLCRLVNGTPTYYFFIKDHLGSTRAVVQQNGVLRQTNQYYPYGKCWDSSTFQPYLYNGKEIDLMHDLEWYDYGARMYEPGLCRFMTMDPLCEKYYKISPYAYCSNNPENAIDEEGRLTIFINGFHWGWEGGSSLYWNGFDNAVMNHFNDENALYYDGSLGGIFGLSTMQGNQITQNFLSSYSSNLFAETRYNAGYGEGKNSVANLLNTLQRNKNGDITEPIRIISHSMGGAYAKGFVQALMDYVKVHASGNNGLKIFEYDFAPYQPEQQKAVNGVETFQYSHVNDLFAGNNKISGAHYMQTKNDENHRHSISSFLEYVSRLPEGKYEVEKGQIKGAR